MKKILFILEKFYPHKTAITNCLEPIFEEMNHQNIEIDILTFRQNKEEKNCDKYKYINIYRVNDDYNINNLKLLNIYYRIKRKFFFKNKIVNYGLQLIKEKKYDAIIACSYPFFDEEIAYHLSTKTNIPFFSYEFDPFYNNNVLGIKGKEKRLKKEIKILNKAKKIFLPQENYDENLKCELKELKDKYIPMEYALIKKPNFKIVSPKNNKIKFTFTGTFYDEVRLPFTMLDFFENISFDYEIELYYITNEEINKKLLNYQKKFKDHLKLYANKTKEECNLALANTNIVLNIGNKMSNQTPSKVYELISLGKPILNFYSNINDTSKKLLSKYSLSYNIYSEYDNSVIKEVEHFCLANKNVILPYEEATKNYLTGRDVAKKFIDEVRNNCDNK